MTKLTKEQQAEQQQIKAISSNNFFVELGDKDVAICDEHGHALTPDEALTYNHETFKSARTLSNMDKGISPYSIDYIVQKSELHSELDAVFADSKPPKKSTNMGM